MLSQLLFKRIHSEIVYFVNNNIAVSQKISEKNKVLRTVYSSQGIVAE